MPGSTSRRDQHEDPRDNTVDLPRIDVDGLTDYFRRAAPMLEPEPAGRLEPLPEQEPAGRLEPRRDDLRHPYAEPDEPRPSAWRAVDGTPTPAADGTPTPSADGTPTPAADGALTPAADGAPDSAPTTRPEPAEPTADQVAPTSAASSSEVSAPAPAAERERSGPKSGRPAAEAGARDRTKVSDSAGRAPTGSLADLRSRLDRLPDGHPSSPYEDDGHARPMAIRLKQLELGLPPPGREVAAGLDPARAEHPPAEVSAPNGPDTPAIAEPADVDPEPTGLSESSPAPRDLVDPYAASGAGKGAPATAESNPRADLTLGPWRPTPTRRVSGLEALSARGGNGHGAANGHGNGSRRRESLVEPDRAARASARPDRRDTAEYRTAETPAVDLRELVERTLATGRTAEGRNALGSYGSSGLTPMMQRIAAHLPFGGLAPGSEANSLKSSDRLTAKLDRLVTRNPGRTAEELAAAIGDVVRYAFAFEPADYVEGTLLVHRRLKSHGFDLELRRNRWESPEYKGVFTQWRDPAHHIAFEVQFHTTASWAVVQRTHDAYVQITTRVTPAAERATLRARQVAAADAAKAPPNWAELGDFRLEAR